MHKSTIVAISAFVGFGSFPLLVCASARQLKIKSRRLFKPSASGHTLMSTEVVIVIKDGGWRQRGAFEDRRQCQSAADCIHLQDWFFFPSVSARNSPTDNLKNYSHF